MGAGGQVAPRASPFPTAQGSRGAQHAGGMGRGWGTLQAGSPGWSRQHRCLQAAGVWAHGCLQQHCLSGSRCPHLPGCGRVCRQEVGGGSCVCVCVCVCACMCMCTTISVCVWVLHPCRHGGTLVSWSWGDPAVLAGGMARAVPCWAISQCATPCWIGRAGREEEEPSQRKPHPSFLLPSRPSPALFLAPVCPASSLPGQGLALRPSGTLAGGERGNPTAGTLSLPAPCSPHPVATITLDPTAVPHQPPHGTARHNTEVGASRPTCQHRIRPSCPPASALTQSPALQVSPGLSPSSGLAGGLAGPLSPRAGGVGREREPLGRWGGGRMGGGRCFWGLCPS